jgi:hypothetical protein
MGSSAARREEKKQERDRRALAGEIPTLDFEFNPAQLLILGPIITTSIGIAESHRQQLEKAGQPIPPPIQCRFLLDTGADGCLVKHDIAERAGLKLINENVPIGGVGVDATGRIYMGRIYFRFPSRRVPGVSHNIAIDC